MDFRRHYDMLNSLHEAAPHLIKKTCYEMSFTVAPSVYRPHVEFYVEATPLSGKFTEVKNIYEGEVFVADVEEFYVFSHTGNNIFLASFSNEGVSEEAANSVLRKSSFDLVNTRYREAVDSGFNIGEHFWGNTHRWNVHKNSEEHSWCMFDSDVNSVDDSFMLELSTFLKEEFLPVLKVFPAKNMFDLFELFDNNVVGKDFMKEVVRKFWTWNDEYFYTEFAEPYRFLKHPDWNSNNRFDEGLHFNMEANSLGKNITTAIFVPHVQKIGEQFGGKHNCAHCGVKNVKQFVKTGNHVRTVESLCDVCAVKTHELRKKMISFTGDNYDEKTSIYSLMLADVDYNVLTESQLVSLILDFPEFKKEILSSPNASDKVKTAAALTKTAADKYV